MSLNKLENGLKGIIQSAPIVFRDRLGLQLKPRWLWLGLTDRCNSHCKTCNIWRQKHTPVKDCLSPSELFKFLCDPMMRNVNYVLNSGGECTLVDLKAYLKAEYDALPWATLQISSNALLPDRLLDAVFYAVELGVPKVDVGLSIDGIGAEHDAVRGVKNNFEKLELVISELTRLRKDYPQVHVSMGSTLFNLTAKNAESLYDYSRKVGVPFSWHWYNESSFYENEGNCDDSDVKQVIDGLPSKYLYWSLWQKYLRTGIMPKFRCFALKTFLAVHCNGDVSPCLSRWNHIVGNIKEQSIRKIWNSYKVAIERDDIRDCIGCLNSWGFGWSVNSLYYPKVLHRIKSLLC